MVKRYFEQMLYVATFMLLLVACGLSKEEKAGALLVEAKGLFEKDNFNGARILVDSLEKSYPEEIEAIADGRRLLWQVELKEQQNSIEYYDSLLVVERAKIIALSKDFVYKPGPLPGHPGEYTHKRQKISNSYDRVFLKAHVQDDGVFCVSSRYHGKSYIKHDAIRVYHKGKSMQTLKVPSDNVKNRRFDDGTEKWEIVRYYDETENGIVNFIAANIDQPLKVVFLGEKYHYIVLEKYDKEAIVNGAILASVFKNVRTLEQSRAQNVKRIKALKRKAAEGKL